MNYGVIVAFMLFLSTIIAWQWVTRKHKEKRKQVKWVLFVLYFWVFNFIELIVLAAVYKLS